MADSEVEYVDKNALQAYDAALQELVKAYVDAQAVTADEVAQTVLAMITDGNEVEY